ncbi:hypothetical protein WN943_000943 [Citrus x changshan-huyou]
MGFVEAEVRSLSLEGVLQRRDRKCQGVVTPRGGNGNS